MVQNHISHMELNRRYYRFDELKVTEKILGFSGDLTEYIPPNSQLVKAKLAKLLVEMKLFRSEAI